MKKHTIFGLFALFVVGMVFSTSMISAYKGDYTEKGPEFNEERHELMEEAFETHDYDAWYALMSENERTPKVLDLITEENFETFALAHKAAEDGDFETAAELRAELGLNNGNGPRDGTGFGKMNSQKNGQGKGQGQKMQQNNFVDSDNDGNCDNLNSHVGQGRGRKMEMMS
ncbi:hypothetical protein HOD20_02725 [archaeon]|nr:hypothetical protein [archaeon]MBT4647289.1 hypothetical protein [archaeon]MBT7391684.1 hypothetical protein [archaeon]